MRDAPTLRACRNRRTRPNATTADGGFDSAKVGPRKSHAIGRLGPRHPLDYQLTGSALPSS